MKNFPHQHNQFDKLRNALKVIHDLQAAGKDASDDGTLGDALALNETHRFRGLNYDTKQGLKRRIRNHLQSEHAKPASKQGSRTAARENRKTLRHLGWIASGSTNVTSNGAALLQTRPNSSAELALIQPAVASIEVTDTQGRTSHPIVVLLRLVDNVAFTSTDGLELALEAETDTENEFQRIVQLAKLNSDDRRKRLLNLGATEHKIANARKILPKFAENAKLIARASNGTFVLTNDGAKAIGTLAAPTNKVKRTRTKRPPRRRKKDINFTDNPSTLGRSRSTSEQPQQVASPEDQQAAKDLIEERTERHQQLVRATARACRPGQFSENQFSYDLLVDLGTPGPIDLIEAKSIDNDAQKQIRNAVGQLLYYEHFIVRPTYPTRDIVKTVTVDKDVDSELAGFLESLDIGLVFVDRADLHIRNTLAANTSPRLFRPSS
ncbi:hypothetical protein [Candidatus Poriferisodalis sp.]|uniref:hypothetical protein n=1 Tax=Candidatus Poriferisodalis sp. TaxID=3101277 RepID=UPI003B01E0BC